MKRFVIMKLSVNTCNIYRHYMRASHFFYSSILLFVVNEMQHQELSYLERAQPSL